MAKNKLSATSSFSYEYCEELRGWLPNMWTSARAEGLFYATFAEPRWDMADMALGSFYSVLDIVWGLQLSGTAAIARHLLKPMFRRNDTTTATA